MKILILFALIFLSGCSSTKPLEIFTKAEEKTPLALSDPDPIQTVPFRWVVITEDNAAEIFAKLKEEGVDPVLFGLTDKGYEALSLNMAEIRRYIILQKEILKQYRDYYENVQKKEKG